MHAQTEKLDTFNAWQLVANLVALLGLALLPYLVWIVVIILQQY